MDEAEEINVLKPIALVVMAADAISTEMPDLTVSTTVSMDPSEAAREREFLSEPEPEDELEVEPD